MDHHTTPSYVRLLNMLGAIRDMAPFNRLKPEENLLLDALVVRWHLRDHITVSELMLCGQFGSQTTTYRRVIGLRDKGLVSFKVDKSDRRVKYVQPTSLAKDYMSKINDCVAELRGT